MKRAFTLAEILVTLLIMGALAAIAIPVVANIPDDWDYPTRYKSAVTIAQQTVTDLLIDGRTYVDAEDFGLCKTNGSGVKDVNDTYFCEQFVDKLNIIGTSDCAAGASGVNFTTTNGMEWSGFIQANANFDNDGWGTAAEPNDKQIEITIDLDGAGKGDDTADLDILTLEIRGDGKIIIPSGGAEETYLRD